MPLAVRAIDYRFNFVRGLRARSVPERTIVIETFRGSFYQSALIQTVWQGRILELVVPEFHRGRDEEKHKKTESFGYHYNK